MQPANAMMTTTGHTGGEVAVPGEKDVETVRLYVATGSRHSSVALRNINDYCRTRHDGEVRIEVVDVVAEPERALEDGIFLTPVLVRAAPGNQRVLIGSLTDWSALKEFFE